MGEGKIAENPKKESMKRKQSYLINLFKNLTSLSLIIHFCSKIKRFSIYFSLCPSSPLPENTFAVTF